MVSKDNQHLSEKLSHGGKVGLVDSTVRIDWGLVEKPAQVNQERPEWVGYELESESCLGGELIACAAARSLICGCKITSIDG